MVLLRSLLLRIRSVLVVLDTTAVVNREFTQRPRWLVVAISKLLINPSAACRVFLRKLAMKIQLEFAVPQNDATEVVRLLDALRVHCPAIGRAVIGTPVFTPDKRRATPAVLVTIDSTQLITKIGQVGAVCT